MDDVAWFILTVLIGVACWRGGCAAGARSAGCARGAAWAGVTGLVLWAWLMKHPEVACRAIPLWLLARTEGVGMVPFFFGLMGVAWSCAGRPRQRAAVGWAVALGLLVFTHNGRWMLQATPVEVLGSTHGDALVLQSQDYTCVAASSASLLNRLGHRTSEAEMAELTRTRPNVGSTSIRAADGINRLLISRTTAKRASILSLPMSQLHSLDEPFLTPLRSAPGTLHMVLVLHVKPTSVELFDPVTGPQRIPPELFAEAYTGHIITVQ